MRSPHPLHPWFQRARPGSRALVFAHRGGAGLRPENTTVAFEHAASLGVDGIELDLRLSRDGEPVVFHDPDLDRTTDASGPVSALTADELARVDAGVRFIADDGQHWRGRAGGVPRFREVLRRLPGLPLIAELKGVNPSLARAAVAVAADEGALDRVCFAGFADETLAAARRADPRVGSSAARDEIRRALYKSYVYWPLGRTGYGAFQVPEAANGTRIVTPRFVRHAHRAGLLMQVWTVNDETDMRRLLAWGVDGLITDRPDRALAMVAAVRSSDCPDPPRGRP